MSVTVLGRGGEGMRNLGLCYVNVGEGAQWVYLPKV